MLRMLLLASVTVLLAGPAAAALPEVRAGGKAEACSLTIAGSESACDNYFYLATADGKVSIFILIKAHGVAFTGSSEEPATDERYVFPVDVLRREEGDSAKDHDATGECVVTTSGSGRHRAISMECNADSDLGHATLMLSDDNARVMVH